MTLKRFLREFERKNRMDTNFHNIFPLGEKNEWTQKYFSGKSYLCGLCEGEVSVVNVTFEPGCRNNWHIHHGHGQLLLCTAGIGCYQEWGQPVRELHPGDVVQIPPEVKHWHGAATDSWFAHLAVSVPKEGASTEWLETVK